MTPTYSITKAVPEEAANYIELSSYLDRMRMGIYNRFVNNQQNIKQAGAELGQAQYKIC